MGSHKSVNIENTFKRRIDHLTLNKTNVSDFFFVAKILVKGDRLEITLCQAVATVIRDHDFDLLLVFDGRKINLLIVFAVTNKGRVCCFIVSRSHALHSKRIFQRETDDYFFCASDFRQIHKNLLSRQSDRNREVTVNIFAVPSGQRDITLAKSVVLEHEIKFYNFHDRLLTLVFEVKNHCHPGRAKRVGFSRNLPVGMVKKPCIVPIRQIVLQPGFVRNVFVGRHIIFAIRKRFVTKSLRIQFEFLEREFCFHAKI